MSKYFEKINERIAANWLKDFADNEAKKIVEKQANDPASPMQNILSILSGNKKNAVEAKVQELRARVGLDLLNDVIEKSGESETAKCASKKPLSLRHKIALEQSMEELDKGKLQVFINKTVESRNGKIDTPAMLDLLKDAFGLDGKTLKVHAEELMALINESKKNFSPRKYRESISPELLAQPDRLEGFVEAPWLPSKK